MATPSEKKRIERQFLVAAQQVTNLIPDGAFEPREKPDFTLHTDCGAIGIEVTELMLPPESPNHFEPAKVDDLHQKLVRMAESIYYEDSDAIPAAVTVSLRNEKTDNVKLARSLAELVKGNIGCAVHSAIVLSGRSLPNGVTSLSMWQERKRWTGGGCHGITLEQLRTQVEKAILAKEQLLPSYRQNLPDQPIWLFMYTDSPAARGFEFPSANLALSAPSTFDKVLWYSVINNAVIELHRSSKT